MQLNFHSQKEAISSILIVSESKRIELYAGKNEEYLSTFNGQMLEESDSDMKVYSISVEITRPLNECSLKLTGVSQSCWILGIIVSYSTKSPEMIQESFNVENVNSLLDNSQLSDKAAEFKKLFETFQASCGKGKIIMVTSAVYGRMKTGECIENIRVV